jgi:hypothetical protein
MLLKNQGRILFKKYLQENYKLNEYEMYIEEQFYWTHREKLLTVMKYFLNNILIFDEFEITFMLLHRKTTKKN